MSITSNRLPNGSLTADLLTPLNGDFSRSLSRSPHPYHRRSNSLQNAQREINLMRLKYGESSDSTESEERATEADDEKGPILKGLPAPPLRGRKGLRGSKTPADLTPAISPFPTPPAISDKVISYFTGHKHRKVSKLDFGEQQHRIEAYKKYVNKRRSEIARRCTETILLAFIGTAACGNAIQSGELQIFSHELYVSLCMLAVLYSLYPCRVALHKFRNGHGFILAVREGFHIPSAFDPGSLMYPIFLPFFISASLLPSTSDTIMTNIILGLSSLPPSVIPAGNMQPFDTLHWVLSLTPILKRDTSLTTSTPGTSRSVLDREELVLLFPLHKAILATLKYLTATSLDPTEIQLLSTGMINLFLFAVYPQAEILKALLWVGALCLFILCQKPLSWEVAIARIPSWKFARNKSPRKGLLSISENLLKAILPHGRFAQSQSLASDDEDYEYLKSARRMARKQTRFRRTKTSGPQSDLEPILSERDKDSTEADMGGLQRSVTVSAVSSHTNVPLRRNKTSMGAQNSGFLSLTYIQAQGCKWLISGYVFSTAAAIILIVVRYYVSERALSSSEPFGWAIGYLFGDIQPLRLWVVSNNLESWIKLPGHLIHNIAYEGSGWIEHFRQTQLGPANTRLCIAGYCIGILTVGIGVVLQLGTVAEVDTRRKVFHGIMVAMLLPTIFVDPCFISLALGLILAIFLLLDLFRASQLPPISKPLTTFLAPYVDGRDHRGPVIVSHIFLLIGCAIPLWLSLAGVSRTGGDPWLHWDINFREISMISGVICVGLGDAAASLIGRRYGKTKWFWGGGKSLEGSFAFAIAVTVGLAASYIWLRLGGWVVWESQTLPWALFKMVIAGSGASLLESVLTAGNDNVIVPIGLWLLTRGLRI